MLTLKRLGNCCSCRLAYGVEVSQAELGTGTNIGEVPQHAGLPNVMLHRIAPCKHMHVLRICVRSGPRPSSPARSGLGRIMDSGSSCPSRSHGVISDDISQSVNSSVIPRQPHQGSEIVTSILQGNDQRKDLHRSKHGNAERSWLRGTSKDKQAFGGPSTNSMHANSSSHCQRMRDLQCVGGLLCGCRIMIDDWMQTKKINVISCLIVLLATLQGLLERGWRPSPPRMGF